MKINIRNAQVVTTHNDSVTLEVPFEEVHFAFTEPVRLEDEYGHKREMTPIEEWTFDGCLEEFQRRMLGHTLADVCVIVREYK